MEEEEEVYYIELNFPDIFMYLIRTSAKNCGILKF